MRVVGTKYNRQIASRFDPNKHSSINLERKFEPWTERCYPRIRYPRGQLLAHTLRLAGCLLYSISVSSWLSQLGIQKSHTTHKFDSQTPILPSDLQGAPEGSCGYVSIALTVVVGCIGFSNIGGAGSANKSNESDRRKTHLGWNISVIVNIVMKDDFSFALCVLL